MATQACGKKEAPKPEAGAPPAPASAEQAPAAPATSQNPAQAFEGYVGGLQKSAEKAHGAADKANAATAVSQEELNKAISDPAAQ